MTTSTKIERRILIVGVPRSGTTLLQSLLAAHDAVASSTESHFFDRHFRLVPGLPSRALLVRDPDPEVGHFLQANDALWEDGDPIRWLDAPPPWTLRLPLLLPPQADAMARRLLDVFDDLARCQGYPTWVEKTPAHLRYVPFLERIAGGDRHGPDLFFVHMIRDGLETVASLVKASQHWQRAYGVDACVRRWNRDVAYSLSRVGSVRDHYVFYEELSADPEATLRRLLGALGLPWQAGILERYGDAAAVVVAPDEAAWKARMGRAIQPSATSDETLTDDERERARQGLRQDLYDQLRRAVRS